MSMSSIAQQLLVAGCHPTELYVIEDCGFKLMEFSEKFMPQDPYARSRKLLENKTVYQAAREGDLETLNGRRK